MAATRRWNELREEEVEEDGQVAAAGASSSPALQKQLSATRAQSPDGATSKPKKAVRITSQRGPGGGDSQRGMSAEEAEREAQEAAEEKELLLEVQRLAAAGQGQGVFDKVKRKLAQRKAKKMRLVRGDALKLLKQRSKKKMSLVSFVLYIAFILVYFAVALAQVRVTDMFTMQSALRDYTLSKASASSVGFDNISSMDQMWTWMESTLLDLLFSESRWYNGDPLPPEKRGFLLEYNKLVGGFRLRQTRIVTNGDDCVSSVRFENIYPDCFPTILKGNVETTSFGPSYEPAKYQWLWDPEGGAYHISIPAARDARDLAANILNELKSDLWTDRSTRSVAFNFLVYNGNYRMFSLVSATISFLPTGLIQRSISFMTFRMEMYATSSDYGRLVLEVLVLLMILVNLYNELKEMLLDDRHRLTVKRRLRRYFSSFWNWVNLALLTALFVVLGSYVHMVTAARYRNLKLNEAMLSQNQYDVIVDYGLAWRRYLELNAACVLLFLFTIFKFISESPEYGVLVRTITRSGPNLVKFLGVFLVIAVAFTTMGLLLFGHTVKEWSSLWEASQQFTVMLAENSGYDLIKGTSSAAFIFYFVFVFIVFFILVNIILAVLMDSYASLQIELEKYKRDRSDSERVDYNVGVELLYQAVRLPVLKHIFKLIPTFGDGFLSSEQMMALLEEPELIQIATKRYPMPTVLNPNPEPLEVLYLEDLETVHGADNALFIMNQLGQLLSGQEDNVTMDEWLPEHMDQLMGEEEIDEVEPVNEANLLMSRRSMGDGLSAREPSREAIMPDKMQHLVAQNQELSSTLKVLSEHISQMQSGRSLLPGNVNEPADAGMRMHSASDAGARSTQAMAVSQAGDPVRDEKAMKRWIKMVARMTSPEFDLD